MKHVDSVIASKKAANKWVGALRRRQSSSTELNIKAGLLKQQQIADERETLEDLKERVQDMKDQTEILRNGWNIHERKLCQVTEEVTLSNSRTIDTLEVIESKLIERVKEDIEKYRHDVLDSQVHQIDKIEIAYADLQEKKKSLEDFLDRIDESIRNTTEDEIRETSETLRQDFTSVMNSNKVTELQMKIYKTFGIVEPDSFNVLVTGRAKLSVKIFFSKIVQIQHLGTNNPISFSTIKSLKNG